MEAARNGDTTQRQETREGHRRSVDRAISVMRKNLGRDLSVGDLADAAYMSPYHFNRVFRRLAGIPPGQFLSALRLHKAKQLLLKSELSVTDICFEVGYNSLGTFSRRFSELTGLSPGKLRTLAERWRPAQVPTGVPRPQPEHPMIRGQVNAPEGFDGPVFIGLFPTSIPQSRPLACSIARSPGKFRIAGVPEGRYHLFAAALPRDAELTDQILCHEALRATGKGKPITVRDEEVREVDDLELRDPRPSDPPILLTFPLLLGEHAKHLPEGGDRGPNRSMIAT
jgi:AraC-like DNA-binding protein